MENLTLKWNEVPADWALCYNDGCPLHEHCLRRKAAALAPEELTVARCVTPQAPKDGECQHYVSSEPVRFARGFKDIYDDVLKKDYTKLREHVTGLLSGKRIYYEYKRGERRLTPEKQEQIRALFTAAGYADSVVFDSYEYGYVFP